MEHPAGTVADEYGMKIDFVLGSTDMECAKLPVATRPTIDRLAASITVSTGVHGDAALHAPFVVAVPALVQR